MEYEVNAASTSDSVDSTASSTDDNASGPPDNAVVAARGSFRCRCGADFNSKAALRNHIKEVHKKRFVYLFQKKNADLPSGPEEKETGTVNRIKKRSISLPLLSPKKPKPSHRKHNPKTIPDPQPSDWDSDPDSPHLFDISVTNSDCLPVAYKAALRYFSPYCTSMLPFAKQTLQPTNPLNRLWPTIAYVCLDTEEAFILTRNRAQYAIIFNLRLMDTVRFLKPGPRLGLYHFIKQHSTRQESKPVLIILPKFLPQNFLVEIIPAMFGEAYVPEFIRTQIESLPKILKPKPGLPPRKCSHKKPNLDSEPSNSDSDPGSQYLFNIFKTNSDCLHIACKVALKYYPTSSTFMLPLAEQTDPLNHLWSTIVYVCFDTEEAFILRRYWTQYAAIFNLRLMDTVRFLKLEGPEPRLVPKHFNPQHFLCPKSKSARITLPEFLPKNFLLEVELGIGKRDVGFERVVISAEQVTLHFPRIGPEDTDWFVMMVYSGFGDRYMVLDGWELGIWSCVTSPLFLLMLSTSSFSL